MVEYAKCSYHYFVIFVHAIQHETPPLLKFKKKMNKEILMQYIQGLAH